MKIKNYMFNPKEIISIRKFKHERVKETIKTGIFSRKRIYENIFVLEITTTEKVVEGASIAAVGYENKKIYLEFESEIEADSILNEFENSFTHK